MCLQLKYFFESSPLSTNAVTIRSSGNSSLNAAIPSGAQIKFKNKILDSGMPKLTIFPYRVVPFDKSTLTAVIALPPVASIGSNRRTYRSLISCGNFS